MFGILEQQIGQFQLQALSEQLGALLLGFMKHGERYRRIFLITFSSDMPIPLFLVS